jgi:NAD(P)-dependent dehydrogenase (short-subunit alcohol dehydrogenase family)
MAESTTQESAIDVKQLFSIKGKVALVTGGSRGIGLMIARGYVEAGARVYISSRKKEVCEQIATELSTLGECISVPADLSAGAGCKQLAEEISRREKALHILVNNAGAVWGAHIEDYPESGFDKVMELNVKSMFLLTRDLLPLLKTASRPGDPARVINIGSIDGLTVPPLDTFAYPASKAALHHLTRVLAVKLGRRGITVNAIAPGPFESKMTEWMLSNFRDRIEKDCPLQRIGEPSDMAGAAIYLASRAGAYVNGAVIPVDGGLSLHTYSSMDGF